MKRILLLFGILLFAINALSQEKQHESYYQDKFANIINGETEIVLKDQTRVDIVTNNYAIEVDFGYNWAESIGQSLHYKEMLNKKAGVLLVVESNKENRFIKRLGRIAIKHDIKVWIWDWTTDKWSELKYELKYIY